MSYNKYHARKEGRVMPNGTTYTFASAKEARRYDQLAMLLAQGKIRKLKLQPQYTIQESYISSDGERIRAVRYNADYEYERKDDSGKWVRVVEDTKGMRTEGYKLKRKLMQGQLGITITEL